MLGVPPCRSCLCFHTRIAVLVLGVSGTAMELGAAKQTRCSTKRQLAQTERCRLSCTAKATSRTMTLTLQGRPVKQAMAKAPGRGAL